jgi:hypothetical protein
MSEKSTETNDEEVFSKDMLLEVSYGKKYPTYYQQKLSLDKPISDINASDLRPLISDFQFQFHYTYPFTQNTPFQDLPLSMAYDDAHGEGLLGDGWQVLYTFRFHENVPLDVISPVINLVQGKEKYFIYIEDIEIPVRLVQEQGKEIFVTEQTYKGVRYSFLKPTTDAGSLVLPYQIHRGKESIHFLYTSANSTHRLQSITRGEFMLVFHYDESSGLLERIALQSSPSKETQVVAQWELHYETATQMNIDFLRQVMVISQRPDAPHQHLRFSYGVFDQDKGEDKQVDWYSPNAKRCSVWKEVVNNPRYRLPNNMSISAYPGLRFMDINRDGEFDLVDVEHRRLDSWIWDRKEKRWQYFGDKYEPPRPSVKGQCPTGSHFSGLVKRYKNYKYDTVGFQSIITSYYQPTSDGKSLEYYSYVYFPRVFNGKIPPAGVIWERDEDPRLKLPVPLQYEGKEPWPRNQLGLASMERYNNQGAQIVNFTRGGSRLNLFYIGLRYRDAVTGEILLAPHRDTGNWRERYETTWTNEGVTRRVKVDICQAFWTATREHWSESFSKPYFWNRRDLDSTGSPNGLYILPWHKDKNYHYHYESFRNVKFAYLDKGKVFAIVQGRAIISGSPEKIRPAAKEIYHLKGAKWVLMEKDSGYYPPDDFFDAKNGIFVDINGNGRDDAIIPLGSERRTYINMGKHIKPRWRYCPAFDIPRGCNLTDGSSQLIDLNNDKALDIFVGRGRVVYINQVKSPSETRLTYMTSFTDENGKQRSVVEIQ